MYLCLSVTKNSILKNALITFKIFLFVGVILTAALNVSRKSNIKTLLFLFNVTPRNFLKFLAVVKFSPSKDFSQL